jgi:hypothetical protein
VSQCSKRNGKRLRSSFALGCRPYYIVLRELGGDDASFFRAVAFQFVCKHKSFGKSIGVAIDDIHAVPALKISQCRNSPSSQRIPNAL